MSIPMRYIYRARRGTAWTERQKEDLAGALREVVAEIAREAPPTSTPLGVHVLPDGVEVVDLRALPTDLTVLLTKEADRAFARVMGFAPTWDEDEA